MTVASGIFLVVLASARDLGRGADPADRIRPNRGIIGDPVLRVDLGREAPDLHFRPIRKRDNDQPSRPRLHGRVSNLILATDLVMVILVTLNARSHALKIQGVGAQANRLNV